MELIAHFINNYSDNFIVALALWPLASGVLSVPLIALLYHRDGRMHLNTVIGAYLSVLYALSLVCFTLYPLPSGESGLGITYGIAPQLCSAWFYSRKITPCAFIPLPLFRTCYFPPY